MATKDEMSYAKALLVLKELGTDNEETDELIIGEAIRKVLSMATVNACQKEWLLNGLRWCFNMIYDEIGMEDQ